MGMDWKPNEEQQKALDAPVDQNVLISAGAGSGKTKTLSEKVYNVITEDNGIGPSNILVLTFTNKAAYEMKSRIIARFKQDGDEIDPGLEDQIQSAHIQTFDSFSMYLVKKYSGELGMPDTVNIIDDSIISARENEFLDDILLEHYRNNDTDLLETLKKFNFTDGNRTKSVILDLDDKLSMMLPWDREKFVNEYDETYLTEEFVHEKMEEYVNLCKDDIRTALQQAWFVKNHYEEMDKLNVADDDSLFNWLVEHPEFESDESYSEGNVGTEGTNTNKTYKGLADSLKLDTDAFIKCYAEEAQQWLNAPKATKIKMDNYIFNNILKPVCQQLVGKGDKTGLKDLVSESKQKEKILSFSKDIHNLFDLCEELDKRLEDYKLLTGSYTYADIQNKAMLLVTDKKYRKCADEIKKRFKYIMVDEYQDTNDIQEAFINAISENSAVFTVGDIKQSIYAFRHANCRLFNNRKEEYEKKKKEGNGKYDVIEMNRNYRSYDKMIDDINLIFQNYMTEEKGCVDYSDGQALVWGGQKKRDPDAGKDYGVKLMAYSDSDDYDVAEAEATVIAEDIESKMKSGYNYKYKDFAIIVRRAKNFDVYMRIFEEHGILVNNKIGIDINEIDAVSTLESIFKMISHFNHLSYENMPHLWMSVVRSYLYGKDAGYTDQAIYDVINHDNVDYTDGKEIHKMDWNKLNDDKVYTAIRKFAYNENGKPIAEIFIDTINEFGIISKLPSIGDIENNMSQIDAVYRLIRNEESIGDGLNDFNKLLKSVSKYKLSVELANETNLEDAVELTTIHKSKGLEYPIVYMPFSDNKHSNGNNMGKADYTFSKKYGLILPDYRTYSEFDSMDAETKYDMEVKDNVINLLYNKTEGSKGDDLSEYRRLLYVALTRAKECCYIVGNDDGKGENLYSMLDSTLHYPVLNEKFLAIYSSKIKEYSDKLDVITEKIKRYEKGKDAISSAFNRSLYDEFLKKTLDDEADKCIDDINKFIINEEFKPGLNWNTISDDKVIKYVTKYHLGRAKTYDELNPKEIKALSVALQCADLCSKLDEESFAHVLKKDCQKTMFKSSAKEKDNSEKAAAVLVALYDFTEPISTIKYPCFDDPTNVELSKKEKKENTKEVKLPKFAVNEEVIKAEDYRLAEEESVQRRASKTGKPDEKKSNQYILDKGVRYHRLMELTDLKTKDTSFITNTTEKENIDHVLKTECFKNLDDAKIYSEYGYYDTELKTTGFIDLLIVKPDEIIIIDYKLKNIKDEYYPMQLSTYKRNVERLFGTDRPIRGFLLPLLGGEIEEVKLN